ncbi:MAG TPA: RlmE family RNA methyltransferase [Thermoplasmata archaeon]|nr:RlmE family RNA methyltransferase [Thermoplasmata archaeon]
MARRFVADRRRDPYYRAAQRAGLRSRAAFKLAYLDDRFHIFHAGASVLDLGAAPGGWSIVACARVGPRGRVVAVDPRPIEAIEGVRVLRMRVGDVRLDSELAGESFDVVISDMSPRISGAYSTDHARSIALVRDALDLARRVLVPGGVFAGKVFDGDLVGDLERELSASFERVRRTKPPASREPSSEIYLVAMGFRPTEPRIRPSNLERPVPSASDI